MKRLQELSLNMMFSRYIATGDPSAKKNKYPPIKVNMSNYEAFNTVVNYLNKNGYENIKANVDYYDVFATKGLQEISILVANYMSSSYIQISVYSEKKFTGVKKTFKTIYLDLEELLENFI